MRNWAIFLIILSFQAYSQNFFDIDIENIDYSTNWSDPEKQIVEQLLLDFEDEGAKTIESIDTGTFLQDSINAQTLTHSLMGTDHANDFKTFLIGGTVTAAVDTNGKSLSSAISGEISGDDIKGGAANASLLLGLSLNRKTQIFVNGMAYKFKKDEFDLNTKSFGFRVRHQLLGGIYKKIKRVKEIKTKEGKKEEISYEFKKRPALLRWGGIKVNTGLQYSNLDLNYSRDLNISDERTNAGVTVEGSLNATITANVNAKSVSAPIELSTYVDLLYILTPYFGVGANISSGSASGTANLDNPKVEIEKSGGLGNASASTTARVQFEEKQKARLLDPKIFLGTQINLGPAKLGIQYDKSLGGNAQSLGATVRLSF